jgi:hypothetical protein
MIQPGMIHHLQNRMNGTGFRIIGAIHQAPHARVCHGARAHRAWLNCNKQVAGPQTMVTHGLSRFAESYDLGMSTGIVVGQIAIPSATYDSAFAYYHRSDRDLA